MPYQANNQQPRVHPKANHTGLRGIIILIALIKLSLITPSYANSNKDTLKIGYYINDIFDVDYKRGSYKISLFIWCNSFTQPYEMEDFLDYQKMTSYEQFLHFKDTVQDASGRTVYYSEIEAIIEVLHKFNIGNFPFDEEKIDFVTEFTFDDHENLILQLDSSSIINKVNIPAEWTITDQHIQTEIVKYNTGFGMPTLNSYSVNAVRITYWLGRSSFTLFFKLFAALFIAFCIACSGIFISNRNFEARFSLIVGGLFGAIGNKYVTDNMFPESVSFNLSDKIHFVTIFFLLVLIVVTIAENRMNREDDKRFERISFFSVLITYITTLVLIIIFR